jgi:hypothetical protein
VPLAMPIDERVDVFELYLGHLKSVQLLEVMFFGQSSSSPSRGKALKATSNSSTSQTLRLPKRLGLGIVPLATNLRKNVGDTER